ncbi:hypothetical protein FGO68_gene15650 [Halteria grandinella]|uniref:Uncharacterized protein n=1 Tax=Halteria grandinella TaxID=5974 RepID=A0A8J8P1Z8_HALGN|nr:hypothetical protein FGO68_gene15650 [Halteria grandinella]
MNKVINSQSSEGFWSDESLLSQVASLSGDATLTLEKVKIALKTDVKPESLTRVVLTVLALWVLSKKFEYKEDEWQMIARKAKNYLKAHGIQKLEPIYQRLFPGEE